MKPTLHIYLGDEKRKQVQHAAVELGVTVSELIRRAIDLFFEASKVYPLCNKDNDKNRI